MGTGIRRGDGRRTALAALAASALALAATPAMGAGDIDPEADEVLREMSDYLAGLATFSVDAEVDNEVLDLTGQKLQLSSSASVVLQRPGRIRLKRRGGIAEVEIVFDGKSVALHSKTLGLHARFESPGTIDDAMRTIRDEIGIDVPAGDFFYADPYAGLSSGVVSGAYLGWGYVDGVQCHHLAFRTEQVDWQIWVQTGETPLPMKYVITSKWTTAAPQYTARFRNWNTRPVIEASQFEFVAPKGSRKVESVSVNEAGQILIEEGR